MYPIGFVVAVSARALSPAMKFVLPLTEMTYTVCVFVSVFPFTVAVTVMVSLPSPVLFAVTTPDVVLTVALVPFAELYEYVTLSPYVVLPDLSDGVSVSELLDPVLERSVFQETTRL